MIDFGEILEMFPLILYAQIKGPLMCFDFPKLHRLTVTKATERPRGQYSNNWEHFGVGGYVPRGGIPETKETPAQLNIHGKVGKSKFGDGVVGKMLEWGSSWNIGIDLEKGVIGHADWGTISGYQYMGSAAIGIILFGLPGIILTSPFWILTNITKHIIEKLTSIDIDSLVFWLKVRGQLSEPHREIVWKALLNHVNGVEDAYHEAEYTEYEKQRAEERAKERANKK